jgi:bifunctional non-homologous end joining protein LigD
MLFDAVVRDALARFRLQERGSAPFLRTPGPMLLEKAAGLFDDPAWTYEPKWDGFRMLAAVREGSVPLLSRNGHSFTNLFWPVSDALRGFPVSLLLDGEMVAVNDAGRPDFEALQQRLRPRQGTLPGRVCYMIFDCLYVHGHSLLERTLEERQALLRAMQPALERDSVRLTEGFRAEKAQRLMDACAAMGLEGVVMKRRASVYRPGVRSRDWLKVPIRQREEFVVAGYLPRPDGFSTLILGQYDRRGRLAYCGCCGMGLSAGTRALVSEALRAARRKRCPFPAAPVLRDDFRELPDVPPQWVRPVMVVEVEYRQRGRSGLRHAVLKGIRPDQPARQVMQPPPAGGEPPAS